MLHFQAEAFPFRTMALISPRLKSGALRAGLVNAGAAGMFHLICIRWRQLLFFGSGSIKRAASQVQYGGGSDPPAPATIITVRQLPLPVLSRVTVPVLSRVTVSLD